MDFKHLTNLLPSFVDEIDKTAGLKDDLKAGAKKVLTTIKSVPEKASNASMKAAVKLHNMPGGEKLIRHGHTALKILTQ